MQQDYHSAIYNRRTPIFVSYDILLDLMKDAMLGDSKEENLLTSVPIEDVANEFVRIILWT